MFIVFTAFTETAHHRQLEKKLFINWEKHLSKVITKVIELITILL